MPEFKNAALTALLLMTNACVNVNAFIPQGPMGDRISSDRATSWSWSPSSPAATATRPASSSSKPSKTSLYMATRNKAGRDFYSILGLSRDATTKEIKDAYRQLAKEYHPDANSDEDSTEKFQDVNRAYEILKDPELKQKYDLFGEQGVGTSAASEAANGGSPFGGGVAQEVDLGDIFESFFGGGGGSVGGGPAATRKNRQHGPVVGNDLRFDLEIDFRTAVFGGEEKTRIRHLETCETCGGDGVKPGSKMNTCSTCGGSGVVTQVTQTPLGNFQTQKTCPTCKGAGQIVEEYCVTCKGQGVRPRTKQIKVTIPAGVEDGNKLRVRGEGDAGPNGGPAGDLYIFLRVKEDTRFRREGPDIYTEEVISYLDAITGTAINTPVVDGEVTIRVPPGTQPNQVMRLKGNGAPMLGNPSVRGDHYVTMKVAIPKKLTIEEEQLILELRDLRDKKRKEVGTY